MRVKSSGNLAVHVVGASPPVLDVVTALLRREGWSVRIFGDVYRALAHLERRGDPSIGVLVVGVDDLVHAEFEFFGQVRAGFPHLAVFVYSARRAAGKIRQALAAGGGVRELTLGAWPDLLRRSETATSRAEVSGKPGEHSTDRPGAEVPRPRSTATAGQGEAAPPELSFPGRRPWDDPSSGPPVRENPVLGGAPVEAPVSPPADALGDGPLLSRAEIEHLLYDTGEVATSLPLAASS